MSKVTRRQFVSQTAGAAALGVACGSSAAGIAMAQSVRPGPLRVFSEAQAETYASWCDELAIGAADAGVAYFVDKYLAEPFSDTLLLLKYLRAPPYNAFYLGGIAGIDRESEHRFTRPFVKLQASEKRSVIDAALNASTEVWRDPDPNFFYFVSRSDAVDVVYGTMDGFAKLNIPYLAHIEPREPW